MSIIRELVEEHIAKTLSGEGVDDSGPMAGKTAAAKGGGERAAFLTGLATAVATVALVALVRRKA